jgi:hypothetical protein
MKRSIIGLATLVVLMGFGQVQASVVAPNGDTTVERNSHNGFAFNITPFRSADPCY